MLSIVWKWVKPLESLTTNLTFKWNWILLLFNWWNKLRRSVCFLRPSYNPNYLSTSGSGRVKWWVQPSQYWVTQQRCYDVHKTEWADISFNNSMVKDRKLQGNIHQITSWALAIHRIHQNLQLLDFIANLTEEKWCMEKGKSAIIIQNNISASEHIYANIEHT